MRDVLSILGDLITYPHDDSCPHVTFGAVSRSLRFVSRMLQSYCITIIEVPEKSVQIAIGFE
jgi:hypothetical protein